MAHRHPGGADARAEGGLSPWPPQPRTEIGSVHHGCHPAVPEYRATPSRRNILRQHARTPRLELPPLAIATAAPMFAKAQPDLAEVPRGIRLPPSGCDDAPSLQDQSPRGPSYALRTCAPEAPY
eukprot:6445862-Pyramimonas_sp.AAC.2